MIAKLTRWALLLFMFGAAPLVLRAEVVTSNPNGFVVQTTLEVAKNPMYVYNTFVKDVGRWWESPHTFFGDSSGLSIDARVGGCFCEEGKTGQGVRHLEVAFVDPGRLIRLTGGLGPLQEHAVNGSLTIAVEEVENGTRLQLTYRVGGFVPEGLDGWASAVDSVLATQMKRLKTYAETGKP